MCDRSALTTADFDAGRTSECLMLDKSRGERYRSYKIDRKVFPRPRDTKEEETNSAVARASAALRGQGASGVKRGVKISKHRTEAGTGLSFTWGYLPSFRVARRDESARLSALDVEIYMYAYLQSAHQRHNFPMYFCNAPARPRVRSPRVRVWRLRTVRPPSLFHSRVSLSASRFRVRCCATTPVRSTPYKFSPTLIARRLPDR